MKHGWAQLSEVGWHYVEAGEGPLLILLHGFPDYWRLWRHQIPALSRHFRVVVPDMRGYNQSDKPRSVRAYRMERVARDVAELIQDLGEEQACLAGHDWGGAIAWATAGFFPDRIRRMAILNCPHPNAMGRALLTNPRQLRRSWYILWFQLPWLPELMLRRQMLRWLRAVYRDLASPLELAEQMEALKRPGALTSAINYYRAGPQRVPPTRCPTLFLFGTEDRFLLPSTAEASRQHADEGLILRWLEGLGHWTLLEKPELIERELLEWFLT